VTEEVMTSLVISKPSLTEIGQCFIEEYSKCGPNEKILLPCTLSIKKETPNVEQSDDKNAELEVENIEKDAVETDKVHL